MTDSNNRDTPVDRRKFLKASAIPAAALIAGCSGTGGSGDGGSGDGGSGDGGSGDGGSGDGGSGDGGGGTETPSLMERAQEEGIVNIVGAMSNTAPFFKDQMASDLDIAVNYQFKDFGKTATQLVQEYQADKVSIDMSGSATTGDPLTLEKLTDQGVLRQIPSYFFEEDTYSVKPLLNRRVAHVGYGKSLTMLYNEENISDPPTTFDELFTDKWKGRITVDVRDSELVPAFRGVLDSDERVREILSKLGEWGAPFSSHFDAGKAIARGEYAMGLTYVKYANYEWGGPLAELEIENFPATAGLSTFWLPARAAHPAAGEAALQYATEGANWIDYYKGVAGENVYFSFEEVEKGEFNPDQAFIATPQLMRNSDPSEWEKVWTEATGFQGQG